MLFPVLFSLILSFCEWDLISGFQNIRFAGLENYQGLISDDWFVSSLMNNFRYSIVVVSVTMVLSLVVAYFINDKVYFKKFLRTAFFMPYIANIAAISVVWIALYQPSQGPLTRIVQTFGVASPKWLASPATALNSIMLMTIWVGLGYNIVIYLAGLQNVPGELYEAAEIDGANSFAKFMHVTLPSLSHTTFFLLTTTIINSFQVFGPINIMTQGGPARSTTVLVYYMYLLAFRYHKMGKASAVAWVLFGIIFVVTLLQFRSREKSI